jgi:hypothetical protein
MDWKNAIFILAIIWFITGVYYMKTCDAQVTITAEVPLTFENSRSYGGIPTSVTVLLSN